jgi:hypothetical protein
MGRNCFSGMKIFLQNCWSWKILLLCLLSGVPTALCFHYEFFYDMEVLASVFFVGIFFCFSITMNTADDRRFKAFNEIANIKSNIMSLWRILRSNDFPEKIQQKITKSLQGIFPQMINFLKDSSIRRGSGLGLVKKFDEEVLSIERELVDLKLSNLSAPEISRVYHFLFQINFSFEKLLSIKEHRTPLVLRNFLQFSLFISVFVLAPEFAQLGILGIFSSILVSFIVAVLIRIQNMIENPFESGMDDVNFEFLDRFTERLS